MAERWSPLHLRLHRHLLRQPALLPQGGRLLLAVSGGQDSMALVALLQDLQRLHHWQLQLWHGDHRWRPESSQQAEELSSWAANQGLTLYVDDWQPDSGHQGALHQGALPGTTEHDKPNKPSEAAARAWRYGCLERRARQLGCSTVVTGHTASDRAETVLLHLARGSHRRGLASLPASRELAAGLRLVRPLLVFSRSDTAELCRDLELPIWLDPSNAEQRFSRNRIRAEVLPVLEALHPGATRRLSALAGRLAEENDQQHELTALALAQLRAEDKPAGLQRRALMDLGPANQRRLLQTWLEEQAQLSLEAGPLDTLLGRLATNQGPGSSDLGGNWQLLWDRSTLWTEQRIAQGQVPSQSNDPTNGPPTP